MVPAQRAGPEQAGAGVPTDLVADGVTGYRRNDDQEQQPRQRQPPRGGEHATEEHGGLPGQHEAEEYCRLGEHQGSDQQVCRHRRHTEELVDQVRHTTLPRVM
jgi:hypothetical protein